jgi:hypothetical protein
VLEPPIELLAMVVLAPPMLVTVLVPPTPDPPAPVVTAAAVVVLVLLDPPTPATALVAAALAPPVLELAEPPTPLVEDVVPDPTGPPLPSPDTWEVHAEAEANASAAGQMNTIGFCIRSVIGGGVLVTTAPQSAMPGRESIDRASATLKPSTSDLWTTYLRNASAPEAFTQRGRKYAPPLSNARGAP